MRWDISKTIEMLDSLIEDKEGYLERLTDKPKIFAHVQDELMVLRDVRDICTMQTSLYMNVAMETYGRALLDAAERGCNGLVSYIPIQDKYRDRPKVGVFNPSIKAPVCVDGVTTELPNQMLLHNFKYETCNIDTIGDIEPEVCNIMIDNDGSRIKP